MFDVFISYRRGDTAGHAGRLADGLSLHLGPQHVFIDLEAIKPGADFIESTHVAISRCQVALVLIGDQWLTITGPDGTRRLDAPHDYVRTEVAEALATPGLQVIPVLVEQARMPTPEELPPDLQRLSRINAIELSDNRWQFDLERLVSALLELGSPSEVDQSAAPRRRLGLGRWSWAGIGGLLVVLIAVAVLVATSRKGSSGSPYDGSYSGQTSQSQPISFTVSGGVLEGLRFQFQASCRNLATGQTSQVTFPFVGLPTTRGPVSPQGIVTINAQLPEQNFRMLVNFIGPSASGQLREVYNADASGNVTVGTPVAQCDSNAVNWTARR